MTKWQPPRVTENDDTRLVEAARNGDVGSFAELYRRHYVRMVGVAYGILSDRHLAEDAAQEAFAIACRELGRLRRAEKFPAWLAVVCRNAANRMARCRPEQREVVMLRYFSGLSYEQIAATLGISSRAVNGRITRAKRKIAENLQREGLGKEIS
jgi:RNA polymerase sigma-70 factor (ECF subfamily)